MLCCVGIKLSRSCSSYSPSDQCYGYKIQPSTRLHIVLTSFAPTGTGYYALSNPDKLVLVNVNFSSPVAVVGQTHFILILVLNALCTVLIAYGVTRAMRMAPRTEDARIQSMYYRVLAVIVESAMPYTLSLLVLVGLHMGNSDVQVRQACRFPRLTEKT